MKAPQPTRRWTRVAPTALLVGIVTAACGRGAVEPEWLFVWAEDRDAAHSDFLAVLDAAPRSRGYGRVVATAPAGARGSGPRGIESVMPEGGVLFANGFDAGRTFLFDVTDPLAPGLAGSFGRVVTFTFPGRYVRLPSGNVLATFQSQGDEGTRAGGVVELDPGGVVLRAGSAWDPDVDPTVRPLGVAVLPDLDRVVTTSADLRGGGASRAVQVWRLSDLWRLHTLLLPEGPGGEEPRGTNEVRVLADGRTALASTLNCGLYLVEDLDGEEAPRGRLVHVFAPAVPPGCGTAALVGRHWIQTAPGVRGLVVLDVTRPEAPREVHRLDLGEGAEPQWVAASHDGGRVVVTGHGSLAGRVLVADFDTASGRLRLDGRFREPGSAAPGVSFLRPEWPHGPSGEALPHGAVFGRPPGGDPDPADPGEPGPGR